MNSSAHLQVFLDAPPASSVDTKKPQSTPQPGNKEAFQQHLKGNLEQPKKNQGPDQRLEVRRAKPERSEVAQADNNGKDLPVSGEKLPLPEDTQEFLASLTAEQRSEFIESLQAWLDGLNEEELARLEKALLDGDLASLQELLPEELNDFLIQLTEKLDIQLEDLHEEVQQVLASLQNADIDFRQLASLRFDSQSGELRAMAESAARQNSQGYRRDTAETGKETLEVRSEKQEVRPEKSSGQSEKESRLESLVARLGRGDVSALNSRPGGESMQQLIQAAGMGLGNTAAAQPAAARMAASMPAMTMMSQAAAQANAEALANRISMMQTRGMQFAEMRLDPPDLGNLRVQIRMQGDQASVIFQSPNAQARDLLENALPRLKEMLEEQGMNLADASVSEESYSEEGDSDQGEGSQGQGSGLADGAEAETDTIVYFEEPLGLIDYYA